MQPRTLPTPPVMYRALLEKDSQFEGVFFAAVKTTGIFCRPTCTARKPKEENVEYFGNAKDALAHGYRPCKLCQPLQLKGETPDWLHGLLEEIAKTPTLRLKNYNLVQRGLSADRVNRWFLKQHGMTFQAYLRLHRLNNAFGQIRHGESVTHSAFGNGYESLSAFGEAFKKTTGFAPVQSREKQIITITRILTPLGPMLAGVTDQGLCLLEFTDRRMLETQLSRLKKWRNAEILPGTHPMFEILDRQLREYFEGKRRQFDLPLDLPGTEFQRSVWAALQTIPCGETRSYAAQAVTVGNPAAVRAVAKANGDNRISIIVPCHRVIGSDGQLTGYGGGLWRKEWLLAHERVH